MELSKEVVDHWTKNLDRQEMLDFINEWEKEQAENDKRRTN